MAVYSRSVQFCYRRLVRFTYRYTSWFALHDYSYGDNARMMVDTDGSPALKSTLTELLPTGWASPCTFVIELHHLHVAGEQ